MHSFGVHLPHTKKAHCLQHLQQQQEQQLHATRITMFITIVPQVVVSILKCSYRFAFSALILESHQSLHLQFLSLLQMTKYLSKVSAKVFHVIILSA